MPGREHNPPDGERFSTFLISPSSFITFIIPLSLTFLSAWQLTNSKNTQRQPSSLKRRITQPPPTQSLLTFAHLFCSLSKLVSLPSQCNSAVSVSAPTSPLKHTPSALPFPQSEINQCWLELSCNKSGLVLDWSLPSQPVTAWPSLRIN